MTPYTARPGRLRLSFGNRAKIRRAHAASHSRQNVQEFIRQAQEVGAPLVLAFLADIRAYHEDPTHPLRAEVEKGKRP